MNDAYNMGQDFTKLGSLILEVCYIVIWNIGELYFVYLWQPVIIYYLNIFFFLGIDIPILDRIKSNFHHVPAMQFPLNFGATVMSK